MSQAQRTAALINLAGLAICPIDEDMAQGDKALANAKLAWDKYAYALSAFDEKVTAIQQDVRYTQEGRRDMMRQHGEDTFTDINRIDTLVNSVKSAMESAQPSKMLLKKAEPTDAAAAVRAMETRNWLREAGNAESVLIDAASDGDAEMVSTILTAPRSMFKVSTQNARLAEKLLGEKLNPEGTKRLALLTDAWEAVDRIRRGVRAHIAKISGVRDPLVPLTARTPEGIVTIEQ